MAIAYTFMGKFEAIVTYYFDFLFLISVFISLLIICILCFGMCQTTKDPIYPTPPLGQDMTQGHFLSGV